MKKVTTTQSLNSYLQNVMHTRGWTEGDLASHFMMSKGNNSKNYHIDFGEVESAIKYLRRFADLSSISVSTFVSIVHGELNEAGEPNHFVDELKRSLEDLPNISQAYLMSALKALPRNESKCNALIESFHELIKSN